MKRYWLIKKSDLKSIIVYLYQSSIETGELCSVSKILAGVSLNFNLSYFEFLGLGYDEIG